MSNRHLPFFIMLLLALGHGSARAETLLVTLKGLGFSPVQLQAKVGDTIQWTNEDFVAHTATARNGAWDVTIAPHKSATLVVSKPGTVDYYCRFHPNMRATVVTVPQ